MWEKIIKGFRSRERNQMIGDRTCHEGQVVVFYFVFNNHDIVRGEK